jgi:DNA mismatch repair protein MutS
LGKSSKIAPLIMMETQEKITPMMAQWHACKETAKDALVFFRLGDFYEAFYQDAETISQQLSLTLTKRQEVPMCGVPAHSVENYIDKLIAKGFKVAIADQMEDPRQAKGIVKREITRIVTPGTLISSSLLDDKTNNFFAAVTQVGPFFGLAYIDLSCALFKVQELNSIEALLNTLYTIEPKEILLSPHFEKKHPSFLNELKNQLGALISNVDDWRFSHEVTSTFLLGHFKVQTLDGFGVRGQIAPINAAGALLCYLQEDLNLPIDCIQQMGTETSSQTMGIDRSTIKNLELVHSIHDGSRKNTLLSILDQTVTPMGGRLMGQWVKTPLVDPSVILNRQEKVAVLFDSPAMLVTIRQLLEQIKDMERLIMKISSPNASPRDFVSLAACFSPIPYLKEFLDVVPIFAPIQEKLHPLPELITLIRNSLVDEPPAKVQDGELFKEGFHPELDELYCLKKDSKGWLASYQEKLKQETNIKTLKIGYNRMFGYYIEVSKGQTDRVPETFQRRQTLTNGERYITEELKIYEEKALGAQERIKALETELFFMLKTEVLTWREQIFQTSQAVGQLDAFASLAFVAKANHYCRPEIHEGKGLQIIDGRHPVIEKTHLCERFITNNTLMDGENVRLMLITGPNMAGKSTYIRQVALIVIMAQMGSFVPASSAKISIIDKVFSRIGASDDLSRGQSTFMVEMTETANILNNATEKSLVILDEIGRGTSTYDGISIAWAVAEQLLSPLSSPKTLFATHYFELTKLEEKVQGAANYHVSVHESGDGIRFCRKIVRGSTDKSYGIHVAKLAGMPSLVVERAKEILAHLEINSNQKSLFEPPKKKREEKKFSSPKEIQLTLFN